MEILLDARCAGVENVDSILKGSDYVASNQVIDLIVEAMKTLMIEQFLEESKDIDFIFLEEVLAHPKDRNSWTKANETIRKDIKEQFTELIENRSTENCNFKFWSFFTDELYPVKRDMTQSFRYLKFIASP